MKPLLLTAAAAIVVVVAASGLIDQALRPSGVAAMVIGSAIAAGGLFLFAYLFQSWVDG